MRTRFKMSTMALLASISFTSLNALAQPAVEPAKTTNLVEIDVSRQQGGESLQYHGLAPLGESVTLLSTVDAKGLHRATIAVVREDASGVLSIQFDDTVDGVLEHSGQVGVPFLTTKSAVFYNFGETPVLVHFDDFSLKATGRRVAAPGK